MESGLYQDSRVSLYYEIDGRGKSVVLIHGFSLDTRMWDSQFEQFAQSFKVIRYDMRGFGKSSIPDVKRCYTHEEDLRVLLAHLGVKRADLVGLSLGGLVAISFSLTFPKMVEKLVLADAVVRGYDWSPDWKKRMHALDEKAASSGPQAANRLWLEHPMFAPAQEKRAVAARLTKIVGGYSGWHWVNDDPQVEPVVPEVDRLAEIGAPTLVILGELDVPDLHAIAALLEERIPHAMGFNVPGAGHMVNMEAPKMFNDATLRFLRGNQPRGRLA